MGFRCLVNKYDGVDAPRWNLEVELFIAWWVVQMEDMCELGVIGNHLPPLGVAGKGRYYCQFVLTFQKGKDIDQP